MMDLFLIIFAVCEFMLLPTQIQLTFTGKIQHLLEGEEIMCYCHLDAC